MSVKPRSVPTKQLAQNLAAAGSTLYLNNTLDWDGTQLSSADFGTQLFASLRNSSNTQLELVELDPATVTSSAAITILKRALGYDGTQVASTETAYDWLAGDTFVQLGSDTPQLIKQLVEETGDETIAGVKTFSSIPKTTGGNATDDNELVRYAQAVAMSTGTTNINRVVIAGNAGETVAAGNLLYLDVADGEWKKCDADTAATVENINLGIAQGAGTDGNAISGGILTYGLDSNQTGLTTNTKYYASNTAGGISTSAGTTEVTVGISRSTTSIFFAPRFDQQLTEDLQDALAGSSGTPSGSNKFITADDVSAAGASGKIVRATGTALPALSAANLTDIPADTSVKSVNPAQISVNVSSTQNVDNTVTTTFTPKAITLYYRLGGRNSGGSVVLSAGVAFFDGTTLRGNLKLYENAANDTTFSFALGTANPTCGDATGSGCQIVLSILSVSATTLVIRAATTNNVANAVTATINVIATQ